MNRVTSDNDLATSLPTTLAVGGALVLVAGAVLHRHKDVLSSYLAENLIPEAAEQRTDWERTTISAQVRQRRHRRQLAVRRSQSTKKYLTMLGTTERQQRENGMKYLVFLFVPVQISDCD